MRFITSAILALVAISSTVVAQTTNPNAFITPKTGEELQAGETTLVTWKPGSSGTVTLKLRKGLSTSLSAGDVIAGKIENSGSFSWTIPKDTPHGEDYALSITDDNDLVEVNYTGLFTIKSDAPTKSTTTTSSSTATSDAATTTTKGSASHTSTRTKPHNSTMTTITSRPYNSTTTGYSNATTTVSGAEETSYSDATESEAGSHPTSAETSTGPSSSSTTSPTSGAISLLNSPLALVVCVLGAVFYLN